MKKLVSGLLACAMLVCFASCDLSDNKRKGDREKSDDIKSENEIEETETTTTTSESETASTEYVVETTTVPTFAKNEGDLLLNLDEVVAITVTGLGSDYKNFLNLKYMDSSTAEKNQAKGINNFAYIDRYDIQTDGNDTIRELKVEIYIFEVDTTSDMYKNLKTGGMITFFDGYSTNAAVVTAINKQYVLCIHASDYIKDDKTIEETMPEFTLGNAQKGYEAFIGMT